MGAVLDLLRRGSPAAYRLLQLCSVLATAIPIDLACSDAMAAALVHLDPALSEPLTRGALIQRINRLALLKVDRRGHGAGAEMTDQVSQIVLHRLLQHVVRASMAKDDRNRARHEVHRVLVEYRRDRDVDDVDTWARFRQLWPHLEASRAAESDDEEVRRLLIDRVRFLWLVGGLDSARQRAEQIAQAGQPCSSRGAPRRRWSGSCCICGSRSPTFCATRATSKTPGRSTESVHAGQLAISASIIRTP